MKRCYYLHFTGEDTETQRSRDLPKATQLVQRRSWDSEPCSMPPDTTLSGFTIVFTILLV